ncbi:MAG: hypothetical protein PHP65_06625, partial [Bacilli bacterium]|nr:hypothetical protein [Bacilli bacterium]
SDLQEINSQNCISLEQCLQINQEHFQEKKKENLRKKIENSEEIDDKDVMEYGESIRLTTKIVKSEE